MCAIYRSLRSTTDAAAAGQKRGGRMEILTPHGLASALVEGALLAVKLLHLL